jgi:hypothetical protein
MFCDQDDVWLPNKIELSLNHLQKLEAKHGANTPLLAYTDLKIVNDQLEVIHESMWDYTQLIPSRDQKWNRLLTVNPAVGCTIMFNQALRQLVTPIPAKAVMHDWWLALIACFFGHLDFIPQATMLYRQHQNNVVGAGQRKKKTPLEYFDQDTLGTMRNQLQKAQQQISAFIEIYGSSLDKDTLDILKSFAKLDLDAFVSSRLFLLKHDIVKRDLATSIGFLLRV